MSTLSLVPPSLQGSGFFDFFSRKDKEAKLLIRENRKTYLVILEMPGFIKDDIRISFYNSILTIHASAYAAKTTANPLGSGKHHVHKAVKILKAIDEERISYLYENNVLRIWLPKVEKNKITPNFVQKLSLFKKLSDVF